MCPHSLLSEKQLYEKFSTFPRPRYPFPDLASPDIEELAQEYYEWIDRDYAFHSEEARARHKSHRLSDFGALAFPYLRLAELRPIARYAATGAMLDDYMDRVTPDEMTAARKRIMDLLTGINDKEPTNPADGIFRQFYLFRRDALACDIPAQHYRPIIEAIDQVLLGYSWEKTYVARNEPPPLPLYFLIREHTSGVYPFTKYVCLQKDWRKLPADVLNHPIILRLHQLCSRMVGIHNDLFSLPKELAREGDVMNLVLVLHKSRGISIEQSYLLALQQHDEFLDEFLLLQENLPDFGRWQSSVDEYIVALGTTAQGLLHYHLNATRYTAGMYVEPEYRSKEFTWH